MTDRAGFTAPWEARVFAIADTLRRAGTIDWDDFTRQVLRRAGPGATPTYADWLAVLEGLAGSSPPGRAGAGDHLRSGT